jgi:hypothetical protein
MFLLLVGLLNGAGATELQPVADTTLGVTSWRTGVQADLRYGVRLPLFEQEGNPLLQGTGLKALGTLALTPSYLRAGGRLSFSPLAIFDVHVHGGLDRYFGNFDTLVGYDHPGANPGSTEEIAQMVESSGNRAAGGGFHVGAQAVIKLKVGPVVLLSSLDVVHWNENAEVDGDWFFEREKEVLLRFGGDQSLDGNVLVLYQHDLSETRWIRAGSFTTLRGGLGSGDRVLRSGLLLSRGGGAISHNLIVQPYLISRSYEMTSPPYVAYALKYAK